MNIYLQQFIMRDAVVCNISSTKSIDPDIVRYLLRTNGTYYASQKIHSFMAVAL